LFAVYPQLIHMPVCGDLRGYRAPNVCPRCTWSSVPSSDYRTVSNVCTVPVV